MADLIVAKIQNRRGERVDLPQPLDLGEIGFTEDTEQIYIGATADDPNSVITLTTRLYDQNDQALANLYLTTQVLSIDPPTVNDTFDTNTILADTGADFFCIATRTILDDPSNLKTIKVVQRAYVGYATDPGGKPGAGLGTETWVGEFALFNSFYLDPLSAAGDVNDPNTEPFYTGSDVGCISELLNKIHGGTGLVNALQNIEIQRATLRSTIVPPTSIRLDAIEKEVFNFDYPPITGVTLDYSLVSESCEYARVGRLKIAAADVVTDLNSVHTELQGNTFANLNFEADVTFNPGTNNISLKAKNNNCLDMVMTYRIIRWDSIATDLTPSGPALAFISSSGDQQVICGVLTQVSVDSFDAGGNQIFDTSNFTFLWEYVSGDPVTITNPTEEVSGLILQAQPATETVIRVTVEDPFNAVILQEEISILRIPQDTASGMASPEGNILLGAFGPGGDAATQQDLRPPAVYARDLLLDPSGEPLPQNPPCSTPDPDFEQLFWAWPTAVEWYADPSEIGYQGTNVYRIDGDQLVLVEFVPGKDRNYTTLPVSPAAYYTVAGVWKRNGLGAPKFQFSPERVLIGKINKQSTVVSASSVQLASSGISVFPAIERTSIQLVQASDTTGAPLQGEGINFLDQNISRITILPQLQPPGDTTGAPLQGEGIAVTDIFIERLNGTNIGGP